ncbi:putative 2-oxoglutarate-dependent dioxygenase [Iris pallida]|uniref:2-oxoglutarate-dependent dioxygenase n=1 Tax=Iris pallida TaxID=29817 RepID=A0AAX6DSU3_IRIPA|nr:putative 2-oxoglutarate-dependent dioxygenase [Iris pallida]
MVGGKVVQELARTGQAPPDRYIQTNDSRPIAAPAVTSAVPVIDLRRLFRSDGAEEAEKLRSALQSWGLFQVGVYHLLVIDTDIPTIQVIWLSRRTLFTVLQAIGHDIPVSFLDDVQDAARRFFQLPMEAKQKYSNLTETGEFGLEGYGNDCVLTEDQILDWNDRLYLLVQPEDERKLELWPEDPSNFRDVLHEYTMKARKVVERVLWVMAKLLELEENYFINQLGDRAGVYARFNYYPCCSTDSVFGIKPHSDGSVITALLLDKEVEGLQVLKDGEWVKVPIIPHALLFNLGDQMEIMSNGIFKSPVHRVVTNTKERMSVAMFYALEPEKYLEPAEGLVDEKRPRLYKKMRTKDFLDVFFQKFSLGQSTSDCAKL